MIRIIMIIWRVYDPRNEEILRVDDKQTDVQIHLDLRGQIVPRAPEQSYTREDIYIHICIHACFRGKKDGSITTRERYKPSRRKEGREREKGDRGRDGENEKETGVLIEREKMVQRDRERKRERK